MHSYSAIILAGGWATRLGGINKARLEIGRKRLLDREIDALRPLVDQIVVVGHLAEAEEYPDVTIVSDAYAAHSTLVGIYSGLLAVRNEVALVVGCDMPFLSTALLERIAVLSEGFDLAVPKVSAHLEALHTAYRRSCLPAMKEAIERQQFKIITFYSKVRVREIEEDELREIDPELLSFFNVNTPEDLERARSIAASE